MLAFARLLLVLGLAEPVLVHLHDELEKPGGNRQPLLFIGVQQCRRRAVTQHLAKLPAKVVGILHRRIHALDACWRMNMSRIANQERTAYPEMLGESRAGAEV